MNKDNIFSHFRKWKFSCFQKFIYFMCYEGVLVKNIIKKQSSTGIESISCN